jgi:hypothetical protein
MHLRSAGLWSVAVIREREWKKKKERERVRE